MTAGVQYNQASEVKGLLAGKFYSLLLGLGACVRILGNDK